MWGHGEAPSDTYVTDPISGVSRWSWFGRGIGGKFGCPFPLRKERRVLSHAPWGGGTCEASTGGSSRTQITAPRGCVYGTGISNLTALVISHA
jgi:hypothetical protein